jgi:hypothetical protein
MKPISYQNNNYNPELSYYAANIKDSVCKGTISLDQFVSTIYKPKQEVLELLQKIRYASDIGDTQTKDTLKRSLFSFTPASNVPAGQTRKYSNIKNFTGFAVLDFDKLESNKVAVEFKHYLFNTYKFIHAAWLSSSGKGVRCLVNIPVVNTVKEYKLYYHALELIMQSYRGYDKAPQNVILPLFISYDPEIIVSNNYREIFSDTFDREKFENEKHIRLLEQNKIKQCVKGYIPESAKEQAAIDYLKGRLNTITDAGHPILRAAAYSLGGLVANNYLTQAKAEEEIIAQIYLHPYLSKKPSVYKSTALEMIRKGQQQPFEIQIK